MEDGFPYISRRRAKCLKSLMSVKSFHFLRWKLLLMCEVLLGLLLVINKKGWTVSFLARAYEGHENAEGGEDANFPHSFFEDS